MLDEGEEEKRFVFSFDSNTTVELVVTSANRAAKCTYTDAVFLQPLFGQSGGYNSQVTQFHDDRVDWLELVQMMEVKISTPETGPE